MIARLGLLAALLLVSANASAQSERTLNCRTNPADCPLEIAATESLIAASPELAALRGAIDQRIAALKNAPNVTAVAMAALDDDEALHRSSLRRELYFGAGQEEANHAALEQQMTYRLDQLNGMSLVANELLGAWSNANGKLTVESRADGNIEVGTDPVDIVFLRWTCELGGNARITNDGITADLGHGEALDLHVKDGLLYSLHRTSGGEAPPSEYCGAGGNASGVWFRSQN